MRPDSRPAPGRPTRSLRSLAPGRPRAAAHDQADWRSLRSRGSCARTAALCPAVRLGRCAPSLPAGRGRRHMTSPERFAALWRSLAPIGNSPHGYHRLSWSYPDLACREWFAEEAADRGLTVETDGNGNLWGWLGDPAAGDAVVTGSHFDSVPGGGGYDGPLGIVSAFLALDVLAERGVRLRRPIGVVAFTEEEGSRFGVACLGSRLLTGALDPERAAALRDRDGVTPVEAMKSGGVEPSLLGPDPLRLGRIGAFVELHIEQGRALTAPVGVASAIWPHGRWRLDFTGTGNHAGTTAMHQRHQRDPVPRHRLARRARTRPVHIGRPGVRDRHADHRPGGARRHGGHHRGRVRVAAHRVPHRVARPDRRAAGWRAGPAHRGGARRRRAGRPRPDRDAVRAQPDRGVPRAGGVRHRRRLRGRRGGARHRPGGAGVPVTGYHAEYAWLGGEAPARDVFIEITDGVFTAVR